MIYNYRKDTSRNTNDTNTEYVIFVGETGIGKTTRVLQEYDAPTTLLFSLEMLDAEIRKRQHFAGKIVDEEIHTIADIENQLKIWCSECEFDTVIIDYAQLIDNAGKELKAWLAEFRTKFNKNLVVISEMTRNGKVNRQKINEYAATKVYKLSRDIFNNSIMTKINLKNRFGELEKDKQYVRTNNRARPFKKVDANESKRKIIKKMWLAGLTIPHLIVWVIVAAFSLIILILAGSEYSECVISLIKFAAIIDAIAFVLGIPLLFFMTKRIDSLDKYGKIIKSMGKRWTKCV